MGWGARQWPCGMSGGFCGAVRRSALQRGRCRWRRDQRGDGARAIVDEIVGHLAPEDPKPACAKALGLFAMMAGALQLSRVAFGSKLADEVLENALAFMCRAVRDQAGSTNMSSARSPLKPAGL